MSSSSYKPTSPLLTVDFPRLQADITAFSEIGRRDDYGIYRMAFSEAYFAAHRWLSERAKSAWIEIQIDGAYNLIAKLPGSESLPAIMTGSHIDSVPGGGHLDGALGVLTGLECLRRAQELNLNLKRPLELIAFSDEEGRFGGMLGSQAIAGRLTPDSILGAQDLNGIYLCELMKEHGLDAMHALQAYRNPESIAAFVELHIEQGPVLHRENCHIGVVEGIVGLFRWNVRLIGQANHAGTTPMHLRQDAFQGLAEFSGEIHRILEEDGGPISVATIGRVSLNPGAPNVVPGLVEFTLDVRDIDPDVLAELGNAFRRALSAIARRRNLRFEFDILSEIDPVRCSPNVIQTISRVADDMQVSKRLLPSGAAHDTQMLGDLTQVGMIFVPSREGRSHSPAEWTPWEDIEIGANCLFNTLVRLAQS